MKPIDVTHGGGNSNGDQLSHGQVLKNTSKWIKDNQRVLDGIPVCQEHALKKVHSRKAHTNNQSATYSVLKADFTLVKKFLKKESNLGEQPVFIVLVSKDKVFKTKRDHLKSGGYSRFKLIEVYDSSGKCITDQFITFGVHSYRELYLKYSVYLNKILSVDEKQSSASIEFEHRDKRPEYDETRLIMNFVLRYLGWPQHPIVNQKWDQFTAACKEFHKINLNMKYICKEDLAYQESEELRKKARKKCWKCQDELFNSLRYLYLQHRKFQHESNQKSSGDTLTLARYFAPQKKSASVGAKIAEKLDLASTIQWTEQLKGYTLMLDQGEPLRRRLFDLKSRQQKLAQQSMLQILIDLAHWLKFLHAVGVVHSDIKLENTCIQESDDGSLHANPVDFGFAREVEPNQDNRFLEFVETEVGFTKGYSGPETRWADHRDNKFHLSDRLDIYAFGHIIYKLVDKTQFDHTKIKRRLKKLQKKCCHFEPHQRPSASDLCDELVRLAEDFNITYQQNLALKRATSSHQVVVYNKEAASSLNELDQALKVYIDNKCRNNEKVLKEKLRYHLFLLQDLYALFKRYQLTTKKSSQCLQRGLSLLRRHCFMISCYLTLNLEGKVNSIGRLITQERNRLKKFVMEFKTEYTNKRNSDIMQQIMTRSRELIGQPVPVFQRSISSPQENSKKRVIRSSSNRRMKKGKLLTDDVKQKFKDRLEILQGKNNKASRATLLPWLIAIYQQLAQDNAQSSNTEYTHKAAALLYIVGNYRLNKFFRRASNKAFQNEFTFLSQIKEVQKHAKGFVNDPGSRSEYVKEVLEHGLFPPLIYSGKVSEKRFGQLIRARKN